MIAAMVAVTERMPFSTNVVKLPIRDPLLTAKQLSSMAALSGNRIGLGVGLSWIPEEFAWTHTEMRTRGKRADEMIEIIKLVCAGNGPEWVEYHGKHYDFDRLMMSPAPDQPVPIYVGGLQRARASGGRPGSPTAGSRCRTPPPSIAGAITELDELRAEYGRADLPFEINVPPTDVFDVDGYRELEALGATTVRVVPWRLYDAEPTTAGRIASLRRFADEVIAKY